MSAKFSAIIPVRQLGEEKALAATLSNLCFASTVPVELVVVSDGPSESNRAVAEAAQRANLLLDEFNPAATIVYHELPAPSGHGSNCRNRAMEIATGEWIHFADAGTAYMGGFHQHVLDVLTRYQYDRGGELPEVLFWGCVVIRHPYPYILGGNPGTRLPDGTLFCPAGIQGAVRADVARRAPWTTSYFCDRDYWRAINLNPDEMAATDTPLCVAYGNLDNNDHHGKPFRGELLLAGRYSWAD